MPPLEQSTAVTVLIGPFVDEADGFTAETGLTISQADVRLSKNGGNMAQKSDATSCTHDELGYYSCPLNITDTDTLGNLKLMVHESGARPVWHDFVIMAANPYNSLISEGDYLDTEVAAMAAGVVTAAAVATDAIDADAIADNAIDAGAIAADAITAVKIADGAIDAATFAAGAIDAAATAADFLAEINAEIVDVLGTDTIAEMAQGIPPTAPTHRQAIMYLYMALTKQVDVISDLEEYHNEAGTVIWKQDLTKTADLFRKAKGASGP